MGTPPGGIEAEAVVVRSFEELDARGAGARRARSSSTTCPGPSYGPTVQYRSTGASRAAAHGAVGMLLRSVGQPGLRTPHTGALNYAPDQPRIPAAAIANEDADRLQRLQDRGQKLVVRLTMEARMLPDAESANVIGEIVGPRAPRGSRRARLPPRLLGRRHRRDRRRRRVHRVVGGRPAHEEAGPARRAGRSARCCTRTRRTACAAASPIATSTWPTWPTTC
ncbi:MAG: hypothetical protein MZV64_73195 [Ignavibacteriales bacterium]|nr:hypothetical protein [Ignavibacteriales bacterium]